MESRAKTCTTASRSKSKPSSGPAGAVASVHEDGARPGDRRRPRRPSRPRPSAATPGKGAADGSAPAALYNQELSFVREMGGEFAAEFPKIAGRLGSTRFEVRRSLCRAPARGLRLPRGSSSAQARSGISDDSRSICWTSSIRILWRPRRRWPWPDRARPPGRQIRERLSCAARTRRCSAVLGKGERHGLRVPHRP